MGKGRVLNAYFSFWHLSELRKGNDYVLHFCLESSLESFISSRTIYCCQLHVTEDSENGHFFHNEEKCSLYFSVELWAWFVCLSSFFWLWHISLTIHSNLWGTRWEWFHWYDIILLFRCVILLVNIRIFFSFKRNKKSGVYKSPWGDSPFKTMCVYMVLWR